MSENSFEQYDGFSEEQELCDLVEKYQQQAVDAVRDGLRIDTYDGHDFDVLADTAKEWLQNYAHENVIVPYEQAHDILLGKLLNMLPINDLLNQAEHSFWITADAMPLRNLRSSHGLQPFKCTISCSSNGVADKKAALNKLAAYLQFAADENDIKNRAISEYLSGDYTVKVEAFEFAEYSEFILGASLNTKQICWQGPNGTEIYANNGDAFMSEPLMVYAKPSLQTYNLGFDDVEFSDDGSLPSAIDQVCEYIGDNQADAELIAAWAQKSNFCLAQTPFLKSIVINNNGTLVHNQLHNNEPA